ncbi:serpentine type 7TM GPCR chemoreceptor srt domain-containing protein [Ditylenchus destructor]|nr:serpentine type 7TM GPCR chemoreceptor srt domain-containing protein [Ditylenchus destructor]
MVLYDDDMADKLFKGHRSMMWLFVPTAVGLACVWLSPPVFYNPIDLSAIFNPHRHYLPDDEYFHGTAHVTFNWFIVIAIPSTYLIFAVFFLNTLRKSGIMDIRRAHLTRELSIFLQVLITSVFVVLTSLGFVYQEFVKSFPAINFIIYLMYQGSPAFIYLGMNQSIQNTLLAIMPRTFRPKISSIMVSTREQIT